MSASKPIQKRARLEVQPVPTTVPVPVTRTESVVSLRDYVAEGKDLPTTSTSETAAAASTNRMGTTRTHEKGHKVRELKEVWATMDSQDFLHLTDTLTLGDVWVLPLAAESGKGVWGTVTLREVVFAPHIKMRDAQTKMSGDDLCKMLYLADCLQNDMIGVERPSYEAWLNNKIALCVKARGLEDSTNRCKLANFILTEDSSFTFYPTCLRGHFGILFRKICYHSYKSSDSEKLNNPSMIKCCATKGKFEYVFEARLFPLPDKWFVDPSTEISESQPPLDMPF